MKAYTTRVGEGHFISELNNATGQKIRKVGREYGSTTGRPRRCGWLDLVVGKYAVLINGLTDIVLTKIDVLTGFKKIKVLLGYEIDSKKYYNYPLIYYLPKMLKVFIESLEAVVKILQT